MCQSIFRDYSKKIWVYLLAILLLVLLIILWPRQEPLIKLTQEANNQYLSAGVRNIVFFNTEAEPIQILDLTADKSPQIRETSEIFLESTDASVDNPDSLRPLLPVDQVKSLLKREIPYIEYRNDKDQQLVVFELMDDGTCKTCKRAAQEKGYLQHSKLSIQQGKHGLLDYVIKPVGAACARSCTECDKSPKCKKPDGGCCNCKK